MNPNSQDQKRKDGIKFIRTFALIFVGIIIFIWWLGGGAGQFTEAPGLKRYLEDKYGQEFIVKNVSLTGAGLAVPGMYRAQAHPKNDPALAFEVGKSQSTNRYYDRYAGALWEREERPRVESFLKTVYGADIPNFLLRTHIPTPNTPDPIRGEVPPIDDAITRYKDSFSYNITVNLSTSHELSSIELGEHTNRMKQIVGFVLSKGVSSPGVRYAINIEGQEKSYLCNLSKDDLNNSNKIDACLKLKNGKAW